MREAREALDLSKLESKDPREKYDLVRLLLKMGASEPERLYSDFERWLSLMESRNNILRWTAIDLIGYLAKVDSEEKVEVAVDKLVHALHSGHLITSNHAISALSMIAREKPGMRKAIVKELTAVSRDSFPTEQCKEIAMGKVLDSLELIIDQKKPDKALRAFVGVASKSRRNSVREKAEHFEARLKAL